MISIGGQRLRNVSAMFKPFTLPGMSMSVTSTRITEITARRRIASSAFDAFNASNPASAKRSTAEAAANYFIWS